MTVRVGINGFGRIGRCALRSALENEHASRVGRDQRRRRHGDACAFAPTRHRVRPVPGSSSTARALYVDGHEIPVFHEVLPSALPWAGLGADVVLECTGKFRAREDAAGHLHAGAAKVIISAPGKNVDATIVLGVNFDTYRRGAHHVVSNASCTTNCLAPVASVLHQGLGIRHGVMTTIHACTGDQRLVDMPHKDLRRARAAGANIVPTSTGAATAIGLVLPELAGRLEGFAARVPVLTGSMVQLTVEVERATTAAAGERAVRGARATSAGSPASCSSPTSRSCRATSIKSPYSSVFDAGLTIVSGGTQVTIVAWYDNEWGYATRLVELAERVLTPAAVAA